MAHRGRSGEIAERNLPCSKWCNAGIPPAAEFCADQSSTPPSSHFFPVRHIEISSPRRRKCYKMIPCRLTVAGIVQRLIHGYEKIKKKTINFEMLYYIQRIGIRSMDRWLISAGISFRWAVWNWRLEYSRGTKRGYRIQNVRTRSD